MKKNFLYFLVFACYQLYCQPQPPVAAFTAPAFTACLGGSITFSDQSSNSPTSWVWNAPGAVTTNSLTQNPTYTFNATGFYSVSLVASNGAGSSTGYAQSVYVYPLPTLTAMTDKTIVARGCEQATLTVRGAYSYTWSTSQTGSLIVVSPMQFGTVVYTVSGTGAMGCTNSATVGLLVWICEGLEESKSRAEAISVFPNPGAGMFHLESADETEKHFTVYDMVGQKIKRGVFTVRHRLDLNGNTPGLYFLRVDTNKGTGIIRLLLQ